MTGDLEQMLRIERADHPGVAVLRLDRPPVNALNLPLWHRFDQLADELGASAEIRAVVFWGGPTVFAAGADIDDLSRLSYIEMKQLGPVLQRGFTKLARLPQVTVAAVNGYALGGGLEWALAADFRYLGEGAVVGLPETRLGILPGAGGTQRLQRLIGSVAAKELILGGDHVPAQRALQLGIAQRVLPDEDVFTAAVEAAARYAEGPYSLRLAKEALDRGGELHLDQGLEIEAAMLAACFATEDARIGLRGFLEKRRDPFLGR